MCRWSFRTVRISFPWMKKNGLLFSGKSDGGVVTPSKQLVIADRWKQYGDLAPYTIQIKQCDMRITNLPETLLGELKCHSLYKSVTRACYRGSAILNVNETQTSEQKQIGEIIFEHGLGMGWFWPPPWSALLGFCTWDLETIDLSRVLLVNLNEGVSCEFYSILDF